MDPHSQRALLHRHGRAGTWGNLGCWPAADYAAACESLARRVGEAARLAPGQRVCSIACGAGDELGLWREAYGVAQVLGTERDPALRTLAARFVPAPADVGPDLGGLPGGAMSPFDAVVCVDAAYHLRPRREFLAQAGRALKPGGWLAFTDLVLDGRRTWALRAAARLCGVASEDLGPEGLRQAQLRAAGFDPEPVQRLDTAVLDGFADFVRQQGLRLGADARGPGWRRVAVTAALIGPCRRAGLGYALFAARKA